MEYIDFQNDYSEKVLELWNESMTADVLSYKRFLKLVVLDENFSKNLCKIALDNGKVVGFIWAVVRKVPYGDRGLESNRGWIVGICVKDTYRRKGIGTELIRQVEMQMIDQGISNITIGAYSPNYLFPGVDKKNYPGALGFLEKNGYQAYNEAVSMERNLYDFSFDEKYLSLKQKVYDEGYFLESLELKDVPNLIDFLHEHFEGGWARNIANSVIEDRSEETVLVMKGKDKNIVGYCQRAMDGNISRFGPFGVREDLRGKKLGVILFNEMLFDMKKRGINHVFFLWTHGKAQVFYEKNGMNVYREYILIKKMIGENE